jgi:cell division protein FtsW
VNLLRKLFVSYICVLLGLGLLMVHSASVTSRPTDFEEVYLSRHLLFLAAGLAAAATAALLPADFWKRAAPWMFLGTLILLVAVLVPGLGVRVKGAQRWLRYGGFSLQPSELAKIALPLLTCRLIADAGPRLRGWFSGTVPLLLPTALVVPLVLIQPDLGTAAFLLGGTLLALFVAGWPLRNFILGFGASVPAAVYLLAMKPYQQRRISGFLEAWADWDTAPYQIKQSLVTFGAGGLFGTGLGKGWQKLSFLPEANTDFIFAVIGEELGLLGTLGLVVLWCALYLTGLRILSDLDNRSFEFLAGFTLLTELAAQALLNVAVVTALVPPKGISHPLISVGGSNLIVSLLSLGIVLSLSRTNGTSFERGASAP